MPIPGEKTTNDDVTEVTPLELVILVFMYTVVTLLIFATIRHFLETTLFSVSIAYVSAVAVNYALTRALGFDVFRRVRVR